MELESLTLADFRNYQDLTVTFSPHVNVIYGDNAQGKTNLLEAISFLSGVSHRTRFDRELIRFDKEHAAIKGQIHTGERQVTLEARLTKGRTRQLFVNGMKLKSAGELGSYFRTILFCPEDLSLVREGAQERRRFLNDCIAQLRPRYADALNEYRRLKEHKTRILRDFREKPSLLDTLDEFSFGMAQAGAVLIHYRAHFLKRMQETAPPIHLACSGGETLSLTYETVSTVKDPLDNPRTILEQVWAHQVSHREAELACSQCLTGPHKDDIAVMIGGLPAKTYGSQGQVRTAALSLKLAARDIFTEDTGEEPVLLLDDVLSELDPKRQEFILNRLGGGQVFLTCPEDDRLGDLLKGKVFHVQKGEIL